MILKELNSILFIRHGKSLMNEGQTAFYQAHPENNYQSHPEITYGSSYEEALADTRFRKQVIYTKNLIDCRLSEKGKNECMVTRNLLKDEPIDLILVSPLVRALQTKNLIFANRSIKTIVCPQLTEGFRQSCSMGNQIQKTQAEFPDADFMRMRNTDHHWYIQNLRGYPLFLKWKQNHPSSTFAEEQEVIIQMMQTEQLYQTDEDFRLRTYKIKDLIQSYQKQYAHIAIVSHYYIIQAMLTKGLTSKQDLVKYADIRNAHPYWIPFSEL